MLSHCQKVENPMKPTKRVLSCICSHCTELTELSPCNLIRQSRRSSRLYILKTMNALKHKEVSSSRAGWIGQPCSCTFLWRIHVHAYMIPPNDIGPIYSIKPLVKGGTLTGDTGLGRGESMVPFSWQALYLLLIRPGIQGNVLLLQSLFSNIRKLPYCPHNLPKNWAQSRGKRDPAQTGIRSRVAKSG